MIRLGKLQITIFADGWPFTKCKAELFNKQCQLRRAHYWMHTYHDNQNTVGWS